MNQINLIDKCKNCGCLFLECHFCIDNRFYRHIDDKIKMKVNLKTIRKARTYELSINKIINER